MHESRRARSDSLRDVLNQIVRTGDQIKRITGISQAVLAQAVDNGGSAAAVVPFPHLPDPCPVRPRLVALGISPNLADELSESYLRSAHELRTRAEATLRAACEKLACLPTSPGLKSIESRQHSLLSAYTDIFRRTTDGWAEEMVQRVRSHSSRGEEATSQKHQKQPFNHVGFFVNYYFASS